MIDELELSDAVPDGSVLRVRVGPGSLNEALQQSQLTMQAAEAGDSIEPAFSIGFAQMGQMLAVFTPRRWELVAALREAGPSSVRALAKHLGRDYKNVHGDVAALVEWMAVQRLPDGRVHVPWREIVLDLHLPKLAKAA